MVEVRIFVACLLGLVTGSALAQSFPSRPVKLICPCPPGGGDDQYSRVLAAAASRHLGQPVVVENRRRETSAHGAATILTERPDGYTLSILPVTAFRVPHLRKVPWDPTKDFTYVIGLAGSTHGIVVRSDSPLGSLKDLVDFAKANPGKLVYGSPQFGGTSHLLMEDLAHKSGAKFRFVVTKGGPEGATALMEGRIMALSAGPGWGQQVDAGSFRLLVTFGELRSRWNAPTARELGFDIVSYDPRGIVGPKGMDPARTKTLHDAFNRALDEPDYDALLLRLDMVDWYKSSEDYADWAIDQFEFQKKLIERTIGLRQR